MPVCVCDHMDYCPSGFTIYGIFQGRILEWLPLPTLGNLPNPGIKPRSLPSPALAGRFFITSATWEALDQCLAHSKHSVNVYKAKWTLYTFHHNSTHIAKSLLQALSSRITKKGELSAPPTYSLLEVAKARGKATKNRQVLGRRSRIYHPLL